jgi:hypothetical protein
MSDLEHDAFVLETGIMVQTWSTTKITSHFVLCCQE